VGTAPWWFNYLTQQAGGVRGIEPPLHLLCRVRRIGHAGLKIVKEITEQQKTVVRLALDDLVGSPDFIMDIRQNQPAHLLQFPLPVRLFTPK